LGSSLCRTDKSRQNTTHNAENKIRIAAGSITGNCATSIKCYLSKLDDIHKQVTKFWELEEYSTKAILSQEKRECEVQFSQTCKRDKNDRFVVSIPRKENPITLGESYNQALRRLISLEARLQRDPVLKEQYIAFLTEYENLQHMSRVTNNPAPEIVYYMPHHCVIRKESLTTNVRVVFDASAVTDNGVSFNHIQIVGHYKMTYCRYL